MQKSIFVNALTQSWLPVVVVVRVAVLVPVFRLSARAERAEHDILDLLPGVLLDRGLHRTGLSQEEFKLFLRHAHTAEVVRP